MANTAFLVLPADSYINTDTGSIVIFDKSLKKFLNEAPYLFKSYSIDNMIYYGIFKSNSIYFNSISYKDSNGALINDSIEIEQKIPGTNGWNVHKSSLGYLKKYEVGNDASYQIFSYGNIPKPTSDGTLETGEFYNLTNLVRNNYKNDPYVGITSKEKIGTDRLIPAFLLVYVTYNDVEYEGVSINRDYANNNVVFTVNTSNYVSELKVVVNSYDSDFMPSNSTNNTNVIAVPEAFFYMGAYNNIEITAQNGNSKNSYIINDYDFKKTIPTLNEFSINTANSYIDEEVSVTIEGNDYTRYEVYNNGFLAMSGNFSSTVTAIIPKSKLVVGKNNIYVKLINNLKDSKYGSYTKSITGSTKTLTLKAIVPTISNLVIENENSLIDNQTIISWISIYQSRANIYANEKLIYTVNGSAMTTVLPKGTFKVGSTKIRVEVIKKGIDGVENTEASASAQGSITFKRIEPTIIKDSFSISDTNIDHIITATWEATNQSRFEVYQDNVLVISGQDDNSIDVPKGKFTAKSTKLKLVVIYDSGFDSISTAIELEIVLTMNIPAIYYLEPSGLSIKVDRQVEVTLYTNEFCDRWELEAAGYITTGTTERVSYFGANMFNNGENQIKLIIYYSPDYDASIVRTAKKTVTFTGYGKPRVPILDKNELYSSGYPKFAWESIEQIEYLFKITKVETSEVIESKQSISTAKEYQLEILLEDDTEYLVELKIKNKYNEWSDIAYKKILTRFNDLTIPNMTLAVKDGTVTISLNGFQDGTFKSASILRKTEFEEEWIEIADNLNTIDSIMDPFAPCNIKVYYKVRVFDIADSPSDGEAREITIPLSNYLITNVEEPTCSINLDFVTKNSLTYNTNKKIVFYSGLKAPRIFKGNTNYKAASYRARSLTHDKVDKFIDLIESGTVFCFKDYRGTKIYCEISLEDNSDATSTMQHIDFAITEVTFKEKKMFSGSGYMKLTYTNGEYSMDAIIEMSGIDPNHVLEE